ncbi:unnamed protein product [Closterium sp. Naga37s-1]|nr:unnamed protein product [Closterium sp. Naga37s-1]
MAEPTDATPIQEPFKGWLATAVKDFRDDFRTLLKAKSKLKKMKELDAEGTILHSIRTKAKRIQAEFIVSKALEVEEIAKMANSRVTTLATRMEDYIQGLNADPDLVVSDAAKEKFRLLKGRCIEKAQSDIAAAKDDLTIRELERQRKIAAEDLKKAVASEEVQEMELEPALEEILAKQVKKIEDKLRKEITAKVEASLTKKLQKNLPLKEQDPAQAAAANPKQRSTAGKQKSQENGNAAPAGSKPRRKRGGKKKNQKQNSSTDKGKQAGGQVKSDTAKGPKNGGGGPEKGPRKKN